MKTHILLFALAASMTAAAQAALKTLPQPTEDRIAARPVDSDRITLRGLYGGVQTSDMNMAIVLNRTRDRVGAKVRACGVISTGKPRRTEACQSFLFVFPALRYDDTRKAVLLGEEVVARDRGFWHGGWLLEDAFAPEFSLVERTEDDGFDRTTAQFVELALVRKAPARSNLAQQ